MVAAAMDNDASRGDAPSVDEDIELKMSVVGRTMTESITKKGNE